MRLAHASQKPRTHYTAPRVPFYVHTRGVHLAWKERPDLPRVRPHNYASESKLESNQGNIFII